MAIAFFDLDDTLIAGDSDYLWGQHLVKKGAVDREFYEKTNREFFEHYKEGTLDIFEYARFAFKPLSEHPLETLNHWRAEFLELTIKPMMLEKGIDTVEKHRSSGDVIVIITSTNRFITEPIAEMYKVDKLLATEPEMINGKYTGDLVVPCFSHHKVDRLNEWLEKTNHNLEGSYGYSDSHNDIPLLDAVAYPNAVDPDDILRAYANEKGWPLISFR
ncbi:MAG: HAD family phosphatase [Pseudomonadota bacterium]